MRWDVGGCGDREGGRMRGESGREHEAAFASFATSSVSQQKVKVFSEGGRRCLLGMATKCSSLGADSWAWALAVVQVGFPCSVYCRIIHCASFKAANCRLLNSLLPSVAAILMPPINPP